MSSFMLCLRVQGCAKWWDAMRWPVYSGFGGGRRVGAGPEARLQVGGCALLLLGTIAGFAPDGERVRAAFVEARPDRVALGVPPEDLPILRLLADHPERRGDLPDLDEAEAHFQGLLQRFGATRVPSPDLEAAMGSARAAGVEPQAIDLDDPSHSSAYTQAMKVRHLWRSSARRKKALQADFAQAPDAYALAAAWEEALMVGPLRRLEAAREAHMASRLREVAAGGRSLLAIVPSPRLAGVVKALGQGQAPG